MKASLAKRQVRVIAVPIQKVDARRAGRFEIIVDCVGVCSWINNGKDASKEFLATRMFSETFKTCNNAIVRRTPAWVDPKLVVHFSWTIQADRDTNLVASAALNYGLRQQHSVCLYVQT